MKLPRHLERYTYVEALPEMMTVYVPDIKHRAGMIRAYLRLI